MTTLTTLDILKKGRELIADPARWTQGVYARGKSGKEVNPAGKAAVCYCSVGAIAAVTKEPDGCLTLWQTPVIAIESANSIKDLTSFNDDHTHAEVLAAWDRAIAAEEAKQ